MAALIGGEGPGFAVAASCPRCAGTLVHITSSRPISTEASAITECEECGQRWQVLVRLCTVPSPSTARKQAHRDRARQAARA